MLPRALFVPVVVLLLTQTATVATTARVAQAVPPTFTEVSPLADPLWNTDENTDFWINAVAPADVDGDGDLDLAVIGFYVVYFESVEDRLVLFLNDGIGSDGRWSFTHREVALNGLTAGASDLTWGDFDNDGDPDLAVGSNGATVIFRNDAGNLTALPNVLPTYFEDSSYTNAYDLRSLTWADADNDGDLDLLIPSVLDLNEFQYKTRVARNDGADGAGGWLFTDIGVGLDPTVHAQTAWSDDDGDGDVDLFMLNIDLDFGDGFIRRYENLGGIFTGTNLLGIKVYFGAADWGDFDADGDMDILVAGNIEEADGTFSTVLRVYRNGGGGMYTPETLPAPRLGWLDYHAASWADYNSDGVMDLLVTGSYVGDGEIVGASEIYLNENGSFIPVGALLSAPVDSIGRGGTFSWLDLDGDGDLDYLVAGAYFVPGGNGLVEARIHLYRNDATGTNGAPSAPSGLSAADSGPGAVLLSWVPASDDTTATAALTYELEIAPSGTPGAAAFDGANAGRRLPEPGNLSAVTSWRLRRLPAGTYDWSVRAVDSAFNGGPRASGTFTVTLPAEPVVAITQPRPGSTVGGSVTVRVSARDDASPPAGLQVFVIAGPNVLRATYNPVRQLFEAAWNTNEIADGDYALRAFAIDGDGNRGMSRRIPVKVDNLP
jgi:hypothetical protein